MQPFPLLCVVSPLLRFAMDASSVAAAALAVAADHSRAAALSELLLERDRLAMREEDLRSFVAARHFTRSLLTTPALGAAWTWERAYAQRQLGVGA